MRERVALLARAKFSEASEATAREGSGGGGGGGGGGRRSATDATTPVGTWSLLRFDTEATYTTLVAAAPPTGPGLTQRTFGSLSLPVDGVHQIVANLSNRLRVTAWWAEHSELAAERIERPMIVLGLPRTGTTLVSELLHRDPANRSLLRREAASSVPPPRAAEMTTDARVEEARANADGMEALNPRFKAIHFEAPDGPTENMDRHFDRQPTEKS